MQNSLLAHAKQELSRLRVELEASPAYKQMRLLEDFVASYENSVVASPLKANKLPVKTVQSGQYIHAASFPDGQVPKKYRILELAKECIQQNGGYASIHQIYEYVTDKGVTVSNKGFSAYFSEAKETFAPDRTKGWSLKQDSESQNNGSETNTAAGAGAPTAVNGGALHHHSPSINDLL